MQVQPTRRELLVLKSDPYIDANKQINVTYISIASILMASGSKLANIHGLCMKWKHDFTNLKQSCAPAILIFCLATTQQQLCECKLHKTSLHHTANEGVGVLSESAMNA